MDADCKLQRRGFTLLELMMVMMIALTAIAIAAPQLQGWARGSKLRNSADDFLKLTRYARSQSISDATLYRIEISAREGTYQVKKKSLTQQTSSASGFKSLPEFVTVSGSVGTVYHIPDGGEMSLTVTSNALLKADSDNKECIDFYPTGRTQTSKIRITDGRGSEIDIQCDSPAEEFYVAYEGTILRS